MRQLIMRLSGLLIAGALLLIGCSESSVTNRDPGPTGCADTGALHTGEATFYTFASGAGACMFDSTPGDLLVAAMNNSDYGDAELCGTCADVTGPLGTIRVRIVDLCPECPAGNLDLSPIAFSYLADTTLGRIPINWRIVPCPVTGPIVYHFKDGSNQWWTAVQIRNHRYQIRSLEYLSPADTFVSVPRTSYNYFVASPGMGPGPYTFRVTDVFGHVLVDSGIVHLENGDVVGAGQFPPCTP